MTALELAQQLINHIEETPEQDAEWIQDWHEEQTQTLRQERDALRAECAVLREALTTLYNSLLFELGDNREVRPWKGWMQKAQNAIADTPLSEKAAAVLRAADAWREVRRETPIYQPAYAEAVETLIRSIDALQVAQEGQSDGEL